jgi:hypothetical protein
LPACLPPGAFFKLDFGLTFQQNLSMSDQRKIREDRLRRMASRQGLQLIKNPRRDARAFDFGTYMLVKAEDPEELVADFGWAYAARPEGASWLDDVEAYLTRDGEQ